LGNWDSDDDIPSLEHVKKSDNRRIGKGQYVGRLRYGKRDGYGT